MAFSPEISLGNILTIAGTVGLLLGFLHRYDKKMDQRHQSNVDTASRTTETVTRIERKVDENTDQTIAMGKEIAAHVAEDRVFHSGFQRSLDRLESDKQKESR